MARTLSSKIGPLSRVAAAVAAGALLTTAFAPLNIPAALWLWMLPLLLALWSRKDATIKSSFGLGFVAGLAFFIPNLEWVRHSSRVMFGATDNRWAGWQAEGIGWGAVLALCTYLSLYWGAWAAFASTIGRPRLGGISNLKSQISSPASRGMFSASFESLRSASLNAAAWCALEWLRGILLTGFDWNGLGVPLLLQRALVQSADLVGVTGLAFLPVFCTCIAFNTVLRFRDEVRTMRVRPHLDFFCALALVLGDMLYGVRVLSQPPPEDMVSLRVLLVQLNASQRALWDARSSSAEMDGLHEAFKKLTLPAFATQGAEKPDLVVWPESAMPVPFYIPERAPAINELLKAGDYSLLSGTDIFMDKPPSYTGVVLLHGTVEDHQIYRKIHLVPFGEYLPFRNFPLVDKLLGGILPGDFGSGESTEPLELSKPEGAQVIPLVCFEDTDGRLARRFVRDAPQVLVNCTNDGWFLHSAENEQHLANAVFRCIELRRPMIRAANTGVTCVVDTTGRVVRRLTDARGSVFTNGALQHELKLERHPQETFYARHGDIFSIAMLVLTALMVSWHGALRFRNRTRRVTAPE